MLLSGGVSQYGLSVDFAVVVSVMVAMVVIGVRLYPRVATSSRDCVSGWPVDLGPLSGHPSAFRDGVLQRPSVLAKQRLSVLARPASRLLAAEVRQRTVHYDLDDLPPQFDALQRLHGDSRCPVVEINEGEPTWASGPVPRYP